MVFPALKQKLDEVETSLDAARDYFSASPALESDKAFRCLLNAVESLHSAVVTLYETAAPEEEGR